jgi:hypothetical protein
MSADRLTPDEKKASLPTMEISVEVDQIHVSDGGISNVAGGDIHIHYPPQPTLSPATPGALSRLRIFWAGRTWQVLIFSLIIVMAFGIGLGSTLIPGGEQPTPTETRVIKSATPTAVGIPSDTASPTPRRVWIWAVTPIYQDAQGRALTGMQAEALSVWYFCEAGAERVQIAKSDCAFAQGWVDAEAVKLGPTPTITPTSTSTATSTPTPSPSITLSPSQTPTLTPTPNISPTASPTPVSTQPPQAYRGLDQGCFRVEDWTPGLGDVMLLRQQGSCWDLNGWYMLPDPGMISFLIEDDKITENVTRGVYTPITNQVEIHFKAQIYELTAHNKDGLLGFGIGDGNQSSILESGVGEFLAFRRRAHAESLNLDFGSGLFAPTFSQAYAPRSEQEILLRLDRFKIQVTVNGSVWISRTIESIPQYYFWIVYSLPNQGGSLNAVISDLYIIDQ